MPAPVSGVAQRSPVPAGSAREGPIRSPDRVNPPVGSFDRIGADGTAALRLAGAGVLLLTGLRLTVLLPVVPFSLDCRRAD